MAEVHVRRCGDYQNVQGSVKSIFLPFKKLTFSGGTALVKPNLLKGAPPEKAVTTHPEFIIAVIRELEDAGMKVIVGDSPGGPSSKKFLKRCYEKSIWTRIPEETDAVLNYDLSYSHVPLPEGRVLKSVPVMNVCNDADLVVNLPKLKTHSLTVFTGAVKNTYGMVPGLMKSAFHGQYKGMKTFNRMLLDVHDAVSPDISIMDGIVGMEGKGPAGGDPVKLSIILASTDAPALDYMACKAVGIDTSKVPLFREVKLSDIDVVGELPSEVNVNYPEGGSTPWWLPETFGGVMANLYMKRPNLYADKCISCGECMRICPEDAIKMNQYPKISWWKCIRCYCCAEICPEDALEPR